MNLKKFEYQHKDVPFLKKDIKSRMCFVALFSIVFVAQLVMLIVNFVNGSATILMAVVASVIMIVSLIFTILSLSFAFKDIQLINIIKKSGYVVSSTSMLPSMKKDKVVKIYLLVCQILAVVMLMALACGLTYTVLEFVYFTTFSFYLPLLLLVTIVGFNTVYHVKHEIKLIQNVKEYVSAY